MTITGRRSSPRPSRWPPGTSISPLMLSFIQIAAAIILPRSSPPCWNGWRSASPWAGTGYVSTIAWRNHSMPRSKSSGPIVPSTRRGKRPGRILPATSNSGIIGFVSIRLSITGPLKRPTTSTWTGSSQHEIVPIQLSGKREASHGLLPLPRRRAGRHQANHPARPQPLSLGHPPSHQTAQMTYLLPGALRDPAVRAERLDQIIDLAGRGAVQVSLHDHREQRLINPPAPLQQPREER